MKISQLYSNRSEVFHPLRYNAGLNVVLGEIRRPENREKDTHNLGKSTLASLIDFCLLKGITNAFFLTAHSERFTGLVFCLELELNDETFLTVQRGVDNPSRISFKSHSERLQDFSESSATDWDHFAVPFQRARSLLDGLLDFQVLKPWDYRKYVGYILRSQSDYDDLFQLSKFRGQHVEWKPALAKLLGFGSDAVTGLYERRVEREGLRAQIGLLEQEAGPTDNDVSAIDGMVALKQAEIARRRATLKDFNFMTEDQQVNRDLVDNIDTEISRLNEVLYSLGGRRTRIAGALAQERLIFSVREAREVFSEAGVVFQGQLLRDFDQLVSFNRAITDERRALLSVELSDAENGIAEATAQLGARQGRRAELLSFLTDSDALQRYRDVSSQLVSLEADLEGLRRTRDSLGHLLELRADLRRAQEDVGHLQTTIERNVASVSGDDTSLFSRIRRFFGDIVYEVTGARAILTVSPNAEGNLDFRASVLDDTGTHTSRGRGSSYQKLLCIAFDLAVLRAHLSENFPRFVFHDGVFEALDDRKKHNLLGVLRQYSALGIQAIVTTIDSDIPDAARADGSFFRPDEIILLLHDDGDDGLLFKMPPW